MNKKIATLILAWHQVYVNLTECIEDARVVLDQTDRGTLLPDRVREMRGKLLNTQDAIPRLADLMEELTGETVWPMVVDEPPASNPEAMAEIEAEAEAEKTPAEDTEPLVTAEDDYDASGSTPVNDQVTEPETDADLFPVDEEAAAEAGPDGTP